jgi:hypothetical protein
MRRNPIKAGWLLVSSAPFTSVSEEKKRERKKPSKFLASKKH